MSAETNRLVVDGHVVSSIASRLLDMSERCRAARAALVSETERLGTCWGTSDEFARTFAHEYTPNRDKIFDDSKKLSDLFAQLGQHVKAMEGSFAVTEQANT